MNPMARARPPVAIIAGAGRLPEIIAEACNARGQPVHIASYYDRGQFPGSSTGFQARFERPGEVFARLVDAGCTDVVFAGKFSRPSLDPDDFDSTLQRHANWLFPTLKGGDDGVLRAIRSLFEREGFRIRGPHEIVPELLPKPGVCTVDRPSRQDIEDGRRARAILDALGSVDVGQAVVVAHGLCVGVETIQGTDGLLATAGHFIRDRAEDADGPSGVLYKAAKSCQDRDMDMPAIGPQTVIAASSAGLSGIIIVAGDVLMLDPDECIKHAHESGLFIWICYKDELTA